jgi:hypothetical protein
MQHHYLYILNLQVYYWGFKRIVWKCLLKKIVILYNNVCEKIGERCRGELCSPAGERSSPLQIFAIILLAHITISYNKRTEKK